MLAVGQLLGGAVDVAGFLLVHQEQVALAGTAGDIDVLADFDEAVGAEDGQPPIAPRRQTIRGEPVYADVAGPAIAAQQNVAEVLEIRILRVGHIAGLGGDYLGAPVKNRNWSA